MLLSVDSDGSQRSCCKDKSVSAVSAPIANQKLGIFRRLVRGDSFRVLPAGKSSSASVGVSASPEPGALSAYLPPARILDLDVEVLTDRQKLEFSWTAPGEDFDSGESVGWIDPSILLQRSLFSLPRGGSVLYY